MRYFKQYPLIVFLIFHFAVWSLLPLLRHSLPMDSIEAVVWGQYCDWGTNKHPPLSGWLAYWAYTLGGNSHFSIYALSQLCSLLGLVYVYKLAACFLKEDKAVLATMLLEGVIYYGFSAIEFNVNVVSLALWPMTAYYFYKAVTDGKTTDWFFTGLFSGLNLLNKYVSGLLLLSMALFMLSDKRAREKMKTFGPYLAALVCALVVIPHVFWLYKHDFYVVDYFLGRGGKAEFDNFPLLRHIVYPVKFIGAQVLFALGALLVYFLTTRSAVKMKRKISSFDRNFILWMGLAPLGMMFVISFLGGIKLKSMWGFPALYMLGILLWTYFPYKMTEKLRHKMTAGAYVMMFLFAWAQLAIISFNKSDKIHLDTVAYGKQIEQLWHARTGELPLEYVAGDVWWADNVALFAPSKPKPVIWADIAQNPWFDAEDFASRGGVLVTGGKDEYERAARKLKNPTPPMSLEIEIENLVGKIKRKTVYYGFYNI